MRLSGSLLAVIPAVFIFATVGEPAEESIGDKIKKVFQPTPTPTPMPHKHRKTASARKKAGSPSPTPSRKPELKRSRGAPESEMPEGSPSASPKRSTEFSPTPTPEESVTQSARKRRKISPTPSGTETPTPNESQAPQPTESPTAARRPAPKKKGAPVTIAAHEIAGYENYPTEVRKVIDLALDLASRGLGYRYGSADPANGGMDCSGFVYYVLTNVGVPDVPRDSSEQYAWLRKAGKFEAVISRKEDSFELARLAPGDLLFWTGTYHIERDPPITHAMIYLGREKDTNRRIMIGASDGRTYRGESRYGVSVFDFNISPPAVTNEGRLTPTFVGYGHIPGLR